MSNYGSTNCVLSAEAKELIAGHETQVTEQYLRVIVGDIANLFLKIDWDLDRSETQYADENFAVIEKLLDILSSLYVSQSWGSADDGIFDNLAEIVRDFLNESDEEDLTRRIRETFFKKCYDEIQKCYSSRSSITSTYTGSIQWYSNATVTVSYDSRHGPQNDTVDLDGYTILDLFKSVKSISEAFQGAYADFE